MQTPAPVLPPTASSPETVGNTISPPPLLTSTLVEETIQTSPPPAQVSQNPPVLVWLPYKASSLAFNNQVLTIREEKLSYEQSPVDIIVFWDYTPLTGRLAYGTQELHPDTITKNTSATDLWIYNYNTGRKELWLEDNVIRALWSPTSDPKTGLQPIAVALPPHRLALVTGPAQMTTLSENFSSFFSWSPDGRWLAFTEAETVFVTSVESGQTRQIAAGEADSGGWWGDKPVWALEHQAIIYAYKSFVKIAKLDGSEAFIPIPLAGQQPERAGRVQNILWSAQHLSLITDFSGMGDGTEVTVYELSPDLHTIINSYTIGGVALVGWWAPDESIILDGGPIWSLTKAAPLGPPSSIASSHLSPDGRWRAEVVIYDDCFRGWETQNKTYQQLKLVQVSSGVERVVDRQLQNCEEGNTPSFSGLFWSPNSRYFYYTNTKDFLPTTCANQKQPLHRLDVTTLAVTSLGSGPRSPDGTKLATWQPPPVLFETFTWPEHELVVWDINGDELVRPVTILASAGAGPIVWSPDSQALVYMQFESSCPPSGKAYVIHLDVSSLKQTLLFTSETPSFSSAIWDDPAELRLFDEGREWSYNFNTRELKPTP
jgi:hypothetical protein